MAPPLVLKNIKKHFGDFIAVENLSFEVPKGSIYGILGPNGAGKTTTLRMINNILVPDQGEIVFFGGLPPGAESSKQIGYLPEERGLYTKETVIDVLVFFGRLRGLSFKKAKIGAARWIDTLAIEDWATEKIQNLSKGMQQKVQFATAMIHEPELLILDEPWSGLDPINAQVLRDAVLEQKKACKTVLFSTHLMEHAEEICDEVCILAKGQKVLDGPLHVIKENEREGCWVDIEIADVESLNVFKEWLSKKQGRVDDCLQDGVHFRCKLKADSDRMDFLKSLLEQGVQVKRFENYDPSLRDIFVKHVGHLAGARVSGRTTL